MNIDKVIKSINIIEHMIKSKKGYYTDDFSCDFDSLGNINVVDIDNDCKVGTDDSEFFCRAIDIIETSYAVEIRFNNTKPEGIFYETEDYSYVIEPEDLFQEMLLHPVLSTIQYLNSIKDDLQKKYIIIFLNDIEDGFLESVLDYIEHDK